MPLADFHEELCGLQVGQFFVLPYDIYEPLFPPGEPDDGARERALNFARSHGCVIDNNSTVREVRFVKQLTSV
jgi:hypothetical protein